MVEYDGTTLMNMVVSCFRFSDVYEPKYIIIINVNIRNVHPSDLVVLWRRVNSYHIMHDAPHAMRVLYGCDRPVKVSCAHTYRSLHRKTMACCSRLCGQAAFAAAVITVIRVDEQILGRYEPIM